MVTSLLGRKVKPRASDGTMTVGTSQIIYSISFFYLQFVMGYVIRKLYLFIYCMHSSDIRNSDNRHE